MAVPKQKVPRNRTRQRRSQWKAKAPELVPVTVKGERRLVPPRLRRYFEEQW